jgi:predicted metal-dependent hydrolase
MRRRLNEFLRSSNNNQNIEQKYLLQLGEIVVHVVKKNIKNIHLSVYPPTGTVRISAPSRMDVDTIRLFAISKLNWIKKQQKKLREQQRETPREYLDRESHYFRGKRYLLEIAEKQAVPKVEIHHNQIVLQVRPGATEDKKKSVLDEWYRQHLKDSIPPFIKKWERVMEVKVNQFRVRKMKTKWGSCSHISRTIYINLELAKKPEICLEYIIVHEMTHLTEPTHNNRFITLMDQYMPQWRFYRDVLNDLPVKHEKWNY